MMYILYKMGEFVALAFPIKVSYLIADFLGSIYYLLAKRDRIIVANNLKVIFEQTGNSQNIHQAARMVFVNFARYLVEFFRTSKIDPKFLEKYVRVEGKENLEEAINLHRGVLLISAHVGNWELGGLILSMLGFKINVVAWTHTSRLINDFFDERRQSKGVAVIPLGAKIRKVFDALKRNQCVAFLGDIDYTSPQVGVKVKFFGRDTIMPKGPAAFSLKTKAPIVPAFLMREKNNKFRFILKKQILPNISSNYESDLLELTQKLAQSIETCIAHDPTQWFMLTPRW